MADKKIKVKALIREVVEEVLQDKAKNYLLEEYVKQIIQESIKDKSNARMIPEKDLKEEKRIREHYRRKMMSEDLDLDDTIVTNLEDDFPIDIGRMNTLFEDDDV